MQNNKKRKDETQMNVSENKEVMDDKKKKKRKLVLIILIILIALFSALGGAYWYFYVNQPEVKTATVVSGNFLPDEKDASAMTDKQVAEYAQKAVNESEFQMIIGSDIEVKNADNSSNIYIQNPPNNKYPIAVTLTLNDGTVVYTSGAIKIGYEVKNAKFDKQLDKGTYTGTALFKLYDPETSEAKGQVAAKVNITVT